MTQYQDSIGEIVKYMHLHQIKQKELAQKLGIRRERLNKILNFQTENEAIIPKIIAALNELVIERNG